MSMPSALALILPGLLHAYKFGPLPIKQVKIKREKLLPYDKRQFFSPVQRGKLGICSVAVLRCFWHFKVYGVW